MRRNQDLHMNDQNCSGCEEEGRRKENGERTKKKTTMKEDGKERSRRDLKSEYRKEEEKGRKCGGKSRS